MLLPCEGPQLQLKEEFSELNPKLPRAKPIKLGNFAGMLESCELNRSLKEEQGFVPLSKDPEALRHAHAIMAQVVLSEEALRYSTFTPVALVFACRYWQRRQYCVLGKSMVLRFPVLPYREIAIASMCKDSISMDMPITVLPPPSDSPESMGKLVILDDPFLPRSLSYRERDIIQFNSFIREEYATSPGVRLVPSSCFVGQHHS